MTAPRPPAPAGSPAARLLALRPGVALGAGLALTALASAGDAITGPELSFLLFYLPGVALAAWAGGRERGMVTAVWAALGWLVVELSVGRTYSHPVVPYWNGGVRLALFGLVAAGVAHLREVLEREARLREIDPETGATRSASFYQRLEDAHAALAADDTPFTLAYLEVEGLPPEREPDRDRALVALRAVVRRSDVIARPRGREFALLLSGTSPAAAVRALHRMEGALARLLSYEGATAALGAVTCTDGEVELTRAIQRAYQLMYTAERAPGEVALHHETLGGGAPDGSPRQEPVEV